MNNLNFMDVLLISVVILAFVGVSYGAGIFVGFKIMLFCNAVFGTIILTFMVFQHIEAIKVKVLKRK